MYHSRQDLYPMQNVCCLSACLLILYTFVISTPLEGKNLVLRVVYTLLYSVGLKAHTVIYIMQLIQRPPVRVCVCWRVRLHGLSATSSPIEITFDLTHCWVRVNAAWSF